MSVELARRVASGDRSNDVISWMARGFDRHLAGEDLDISLGLDRASRLRERNRALQDAARILDSGDGNTWKLAGRLSAAIVRFERRFLPCFEARGVPVSSPLDKALLRAFEARLPEKSPGLSGRRPC